MSDVALDASAVLAFLNGEPGAEVVAEKLPRSIMSTVNLAEVASRLVEHGMPIDDTRTAIAALDLRIEGLDEAAAYEIGALRTPTRSAGLSLGDRACLALADRHGIPAVTADRQWAALDLGIEIELIR